ncbi:MAG: PIN domain nuclease [Thermofilum sp. ex4484_79]|nr:MAG: PIN domain nuclease [Thermofilum sp. ex4484_79]
MNLLFDASALLNIIRRKRRKAFNILVGNYILDLTFYEIGNAIWKETKLQKRIEVDEASKLLKTISIIKDKMQMLRAENLVVVFKIAYELGITFYDASYIVAAAGNNLFLVTDDKKLISKLEQSKDTLKEILGSEVKVMTSLELTRGG